MGGGASSTSKKKDTYSVSEIMDFLGSGTSPLVASKQLSRGAFVMIDADSLGKKLPDGLYPNDYSLKFGIVRGSCAAVGRNALEYTVQTEDGKSEVVRGRWLQALKLPEFEEKNIHIDKEHRTVSVEIQWQGSKRFAADLLGRDVNLYKVQFVGGKREVMDGVPLEHLHPVDQDTDWKSSPVSLEPDPLFMLDKKLQADIDGNWQMKYRIAEALGVIQREMRPSGAEPLRGPFTGQGLYDSEGYPTHPAPPKELAVDGAFVDIWGKYAGKVKFATTYKIGPSYPRMDAWVERVDAGDPLYFTAALPVYAGLVCLGNFKNPKDEGPGEPEWVRASDVALVGIALYVDGELVPGSFTNPPLDNDGFSRYGHDSCNFIPGCVSTYISDLTFIGGVFCLAPAESDFELRDDIYTIEAYHALLRNYAKQPSFGTREIDVQINLVLSTNYLANLRQVCAGSCKVTLTDQGLAVAYDRMKDVHEKRLETAAAYNPKRARKTLSEVTYEEAQHMRMPWLGDQSQQAASAFPISSGNMAGAPRQAPQPVLKPRNIRAELEERFGDGSAVEVPRPPAPPGTVPYAPESPQGSSGAGAISSAPMGSATTPIRGPDEGFIERLNLPAPKKGPALGGLKLGPQTRVPAPPKRPATHSPPRAGIPPSPPRPTH